MVSSCLRPEDIQPAKRLGIRDLLLKPDTVEDLGAALHRLLSGRTD